MISIAMSLGSLIQNIPRTDEKDKWSYTWTSPQYSSMKMYKNIRGQAEAHTIFKQLWKTSCRLRHKIFFWLLLHDRVNTRNMLQRRTFHLPSYNCALCQMSTEETSQHLFWDCDFAFNCLQSLLGPRHRGFSIFDEVSFAI